MEGILLSNNERRYLGLRRVNEDWEAVRFDASTWLYFDPDDLIRKRITASDDGYYREVEMRHPTTEGRSVLLPLTARGTPKKLTASTLEACNPVGVYFLHDADCITIASYTTQTTFFSTAGLGEDWSGTEGRRRWLDWWIADSSEADIAAVEAFAAADRRHCRVGEGDFFTFRVGRREYGYGRVLMDVRAVQKRLKAGALPGRHYGLTHLMGKPLMIAIYRAVGEDPRPDLQSLRHRGTFPTQAIMDNRFYYGECPVIGHLPLEPGEVEFPISFSRSIDVRDPDTVYLQYGLIYRETTRHDLDAYLTRDTWGNPMFRNEAIGWSIDASRDIQHLRRVANGNAEPWDSWPEHMARVDLHHPANRSAKREIFAHFGLDGDRTYAENLVLAGMPELW